MDDLQRRLDILDVYFDVERRECVSVRGIGVSVETASDDRDRRDERDERNVVRRYGLTFRSDAIDVARGSR